MNSNMFSVNGQAIAKAFIITALGAALSALAQALAVPGFQFASFNWTSLLTIGLSAGIASIVHSYLSDTNGAFLGSI